MEPDPRQRSVEEISDARYWTGLCPWLSIGERANWAEVAQLPEGELVAHLTKHGYFRSAPALGAARVDDLRRCVETLREQRWPLVFSFVYDQFWSLFRATAIERLLTAALGPGYRQSAHFWTYYVAPIEGMRGWRPHADMPGAGQRLSLWIPLTEATLENGCIYLIPKDQMPRAMACDFSAVKTVNQTELGELLQAARAVPASAGSILGWDHQLVHWGSTASGGGAPRISIAAEFLPASAQPLAEEQPLLEGPSLPPLRRRLGLVGKALLDYWKFEPSMGRFGELATRLAAEL